MVNGRLTFNAFITKIALAEFAYTSTMEEAALFGAAHNVKARTIIHLYEAGVAQLMLEMQIPRIEYLGAPHHRYGKLQKRIASRRSGKGSPSQSRQGP